MLNDRGTTNCNGMSSFCWNTRFQWHSEITLETSLTSLASVRKEPIFSRFPETWLRKWDRLVPIIFLRWNHEWMDDYTHVLLRNEIVGNELTNLWPSAVKFTKSDTAVLNHSYPDFTSMQPRVKHIFVKTTIFSTYCWNEKELCANFQDILEGIMA